MRVLTPAAAIAFIALASSAASAQVRMAGTFAAAKACPAFQSIKKKTNPGDAAVSSGKSYRLIAKNKDEASHYLIELPGASPRERWVAIDCGSVSAAEAPAPSGEADANSVLPSRSRYVLALSWQPAFCESKPGKPECKSQTEQRFDASHFTLHGLWPQPRQRAYCRVDEALVAADEHGQWDSLPEPEIGPATRAELDKLMPGTQSLLHRHEWIKHGTCYPVRDADRYFGDAIRLASAINASPLQQLFASRIGQEVTGSEIRAGFDQAFGEGAGKRVRVACDNHGSRRLITEITVGLVGDITPEADVGRLIRAAAPTDPGCPAGVVDPVGVQ